MDIIYDWLLHNIGNEGNFLTILNTQPHREAEKITTLDVMARTKDFEAVTLFIKSGLSSGGKEQTTEKTIGEEYQFINADQVIAYLSNGQEIRSFTNTDQNIFSVSISKPSHGSEKITFPPQQ